MRWAIPLGVVGALLASCVTSPLSGSPTAPVEAIRATSVKPAVSASPPTPTPLATPFPSPSATSTRTLTARPSPISPTFVPPTPTQTTRLFTYHPHELVLALEWSPDGNLLGVAAGENVHLYDGQTLSERAILPVGVWVNGLAFAAQGGWLALAGRDGALQIWETSSLQKVCDFPAHLRGANSVSFAPTGDILASTGNDAIVKFWDVSALPECSWPLVAQTVGGSFGVPTIRHSPDGVWVAVVDRQAVRLRNSADARLVRTFWSGAAIFNLAFSPDGRLLASAEMSNTVRLWDVESGEVRGVLSESSVPATFVWGIAFSPDGRRVAAGNNRGVVTLWDTTNFEVVAQFDDPHRAVTCLRFSPDGRWLLAGSLDAVVWRWEIAP